MRPALPRWDGGLERVGCVFQEGDRVAIGFLGRSEIIATLDKRAAGFPAMVANGLRGIAGQLERAPTRFVRSRGGDA